MKKNKYRQFCSNKIGKRKYYEIFQITHKSKMKYFACVHISFFLFLFVKSFCSILCSVHQGPIHTHRLFWQR